MFAKSVLAGLLASTVSCVQAADLPSHPFIHVSGVGSTEVMPDIGEIDFEIGAYDADPEAARTVVETRIGEIRALLVPLGIAPDDVDVRDVRKIIRKGEQSVQTGVLYDIKCGVRIRVRDIAKWRDVLSPLLSMQNVDGFMTFFDTSERVKVEAELMGNAVGAARKKAEIMAKAGGRALGPVAGMSTGEIKNLSRALGFVAVPIDYSARQQNSQQNSSRSGGNREELLDVMSVKLSQPVDLIYRIK